MSRNHKIIHITQKAYLQYQRIKILESITRSTLCVCICTYFWKNKQYCRVVAVPIVVLLTRPLQFATVKVKQVGVHLRLTLWGVLPLLSMTGKKFHMVSKQESVYSLNVHSRTMIVIYDPKPTEDVAAIKREQAHYFFLIICWHMWAPWQDNRQQCSAFTQPSLQSEWVMVKRSSLGHGSSKLPFEGRPFLLRRGDRGGRWERDCWGCVNRR